MLHKVVVCPRTGCQHIPDQGNNTTQVLSHSEVSHRQFQMFWNVLHPQAKQYPRRPALQASQHQQGQVLQDHHLGDAPNSNHRCWGNYGRRRGWTKLDDPLQKFLIHGALPPSEDEIRCLKRKASYYVILDGELIQKRVDNTPTQMPK